jgi:hypothetical protein
MAVFAIYETTFRISSEKSNISIKPKTHDMKSEKAKLVMR